MRSLDLNDAPAADVDVRETSRGDSRSGDSTQGAMLQKEGRIRAIVAFATEMIQPPSIWTPFSRGKEREFLANS